MKLYPFTYQDYHQRMTVLGSLPCAQCGKLVSASKDHYTAWVIFLNGSYRYANTAEILREEDIIPWPVDDACAELLISDGVYLE